MYTFPVGIVNALTLAMGLGICINCRASPTVPESSANASLCPPALKLLFRTDEIDDGLTRFFVSGLAVWRRTYTFEYLSRRTVERKVVQRGRRVGRHAENRRSNENLVKFAAVRA